jgi:K+-transporting ATPase KdpF subunit
VRKNIAHKVDKVLYAGIIYANCVYNSATVPKELTMIFITMVIAVFLFIYLLVALIRPEWF